MTKMFQNHGKGKTTALKIHEKYQIHKKFEDNVECIEEWKECQKHGTSSLLSRKWKDPKQIVGFSTKDQQWQFEIGYQEVTNNSNQGSNVTLTLQPNSSTPFFYAGDTESHFIWIVQNCPWPVNNYIIDIDAKKQSIKLKTKNKKYLKVFQIPSMSRLNVRLNDEDDIKFQLEHDSDKMVLTILFKKPDTILQHEKGESALRDEAIAKLHKDGDVECRQS